MQTKIQKNQNSLTNKAKILACVILFFLTFQYLLKVVQASGYCCSDMICGALWPYTKVVEPVFDERESFLCRFFGREKSCYDDALLKDPIKLDIIKRYFIYGRRADYTDFLKDVNPRELEYYCDTTEKIENRVIRGTPNELKAPCPRTLRTIYPGGIKDCNMTI